jgi:hypothetical protein
LMKNSGTTMAAWGWCAGGTVTAGSPLRSDDEGDPAP